MPRVCRDSRSVIQSGYVSGGPTWPFRCSSLCTFVPKNHLGSFEFHLKHLDITSIHLESFKTHCFPTPNRDFLTFLESNSNHGTDHLSHQVHFATDNGRLLKPLARPCPSCSFSPLDFRGTLTRDDHPGVPN